MASDNLNRVFIKAYDKGRSIGNRTIPSGQAAGDPSSLVVRFDNATVKPESPHIHSRPVHSPNSIAASPSELRSSRPATSIATAPRVYESIEGQQGFHPPQPQLSPTAQQNQPVANQLNQPFVNQQKSSGDAGQNFRTPDQPAPGQTMDQGTNSAYDSAQGETNSRVDMADRITAKNRGGDIFRLDRPSYAADLQTGDLYADSDVSQQSESVELAATNAGPLPLSTGQIHGSNRVPPAETKRSINRDQALSKERSLRQARLRIFNPLWEVDRLEWPQVCIELTNSISALSSNVTENLLIACQEGLQVLAVTSPQSATGTSTVACCLAMLAGRHGLNVALVDGNTENPSLCYQTNLDLEVDWHEAVAKQLPLEEIAVHSVDDQVTLVPLLERLNAPELNERNMATMLQELAQSFDLVIVDLGPMSSPRNMVTTLGELGVLHAVVAVVDRRNQATERTESCLRQIRQTGIASIGLVENFAA